MKGLLSWARFVRGLIHAEVGPKLDRILKQQGALMPAIDDLKKSVADLGASISKELTAISDKLANSTTSGTSDADVEAVVTAINDLKAQVDAETATLTGPAPEPAPAVPAA